MKPNLIAAGAVLTLAATFMAGCQTNPFQPSFTSPEVQEEAGAGRSQIIGDVAPDFTLKDQDGKDVTLSKLRGQWIVLYFYPKDETPGCTCEATEFTTLLGGMRNMNAKVYGISPDSPVVHTAFIQAYKLKLELLSDPDHKVMTEYGAWVVAHLGDKTYQRVIRTTIIIDPKGVIRYHWPEVIPTGHAQRVQKKLAQLQAQYK